MRKHYLTAVVIVLFFCAFFLYPLGYILKKAFIVDGRFSAESFSLMFSSRFYWELISNSILLSCLTTAICIALCIPLALLQSRCTYRGKSLVSGLLLLPLFLPPFVGTLGFRQIMGRFGSMNMTLISAGFISDPIDWLGSARGCGVVIMQVLHLFPIMLLSLQAALGNIDASLEEAASVLGASRVIILRRITFPLVMPALLAGGSLVFIASFTDLGTPLLFEYRNVLPVHLFNMLSDTRENPVAYSLVIFVAVVAMALFVAPRLITKGRNYESPARGKRVARTLSLHPAVTFTVYLALALLIGISLLPHGGVVLLSLSDRWFMSPLPQSYTVSHFVEVFTHPLTLVSMRNSTLLSLFATIGDVVLAVTICFLIVRTRISGRSLLDGLSTLPLAIPGIVIAFGYVRAFAGTSIDNRVNPFPLLIAAYAVRKLPFMVRSVQSGFLQLNVSLEEAAQVCGASRFTVLKRITLPLLFPFITAGAILCFVSSMLEVSDSLILAMEDRFSPISRALYTLTARPDGTAIACALSVVVVLFLFFLLLIGSRLTGRRVSELLASS